MNFIRNFHAECNYNYNSTIVKNINQMGLKHQLKIVSEWAKFCSLGYTYAVCWPNVT